VALVAVTVSPAHASALRDLVADVLGSSHTNASADLDGDDARVLRATAHTQGAIHANVTRIARYRQAGCGRVEVELTAPDRRVATTTGELRAVAARFQMDLCLDGTPPADTRPG
jgi:hypothetical protein